MFDSHEVRIYKGLTERRKSRLSRFLESHGLTYEGDPDATVMVEDQEGLLLATGSLEGNVIRMVAVDPACQEAGLSGIVISRLIETAREEGKTVLFVFTTPQSEDRFKGFGFKEIARYDPYVVLLEMGHPGIDAFADYLRANRAATAPGETVGGVVVNCNPFTLGHQYLISYAAERCAHLYVIVVRADLSLFPFAHRIELVREGTKHLPNVTVLESGNYAVSPATFPAYFLKSQDAVHKAYVQTRLDVTLFANLFCRELGITKRFVGTEPYCPVTSQYNKAMKEILPPRGIALEEIERKSLPGGDPISASTVRNYIREGKWELLRGFLPEPTMNYLEAPETEGIIERIKASRSRH
ncbi:MAG: [citrate (pro-3S)-lyase] ligase [Synergistales bacterium]|nr:[citrate (pro-3S)-lyase] ligase [Synergistales bacterium]